MGEEEVHALHGIDLVLYQGELVVMLGASGSGKSTLLNILGGLDTATEGSLWYCEQDLILDSVRYQDPELDHFIRQTVLNTTTLHPAPIRRQSGCTTFRRGLRVSCRVIAVSEYRPAGTAGGLPGGPSSSGAGRSAAGGGRGVHSTNSGMARVRAGSLLAVHA